MEIQEKKERAGVRGKALAVAGVLVLSAGLAQAAPVSGQGTWETTLKARDVNGNAVAQDSADAVFFYDTVLDVTWLRQANTTPQNWASAMAWADGLTVGGFTDWRLPEVKPVNGASFNYALSFNGSTDFGFNISAPGSVYAESTGSELAHLYYVTLGNKSWYDLNGNGNQPDSGLTNTGEFLGLMPGGGYRSSTEYAPDTDRVWNFYTEGTQVGGSKSGLLYAVALRPGDVLRATAVPEPTALALLLPSLGALLWARRRTA